MPNANVHLIALGGTGCAIARRFLKRLEGYDFVADPSFRPTILAIDTANDGLEDIREADRDLRNALAARGISPDRVRTEVESVALVGPDAKDNLHHHMRQWNRGHSTVVDSLDDIPPFIAGVGRLRAFSKAMLDYSKTRVKPFGEALARFYHAVAAATGARQVVWIVYSIGGGSGSGMALDVALHIRRHLQGVAIIGIGVLPSLQDNAVVYESAKAALDEHAAFLDREANRRLSKEHPEFTSAFDRHLLFPLAPYVADTSSKAHALLEVDDSVVELILTLSSVDAENVFPRTQDRKIIGRGGHPLTGGWVQVVSARRAVVPLAEHYELEKTDVRYTRAAVQVMTGRSQLVGNPRGLRLDEESPSVAGRLAAGVAGFLDEAKAALYGHLPDRESSIQYFCGEAEVAARGPYEEAVARLKQPALIRLQTLRANVIAAMDSTSSPGAAVSVARLGSRERDAVDAIIAATEALPATPSEFRGRVEAAMTVLRTAQQEMPQSDVAYLAVNGFFEATGALYAALDVHYRIANFDAQFDRLYREMDAVAKEEGLASGLGPADAKGWVQRATHLRQTDLALLRAVATLTMLDEDEPLVIDSVLAVARAQVPTFQRELDGASAQVVDASKEVSKLEAEIAKAGERSWWWRTHRWCARALSPKGPLAAEYENHTVALRRKSQDVIRDGQPPLRSLQKLKDEVAMLRERESAARGRLATRTDAQRVLLRNGPYRESLRLAGQLRESLASAQRAVNDLGTGLRLVRILTNGERRALRRRALLPSPPPLDAQATRAVLDVEATKRFIREDVAGAVCAAPALGLEVGTRPSGGSVLFAVDDSVHDSLAERRAVDQLVALLDQSARDPSVTVHEGWTDPTSGFVFCICAGIDAQGLTIYPRLDQSHEHLNDQAKRLTRAVGIEKNGYVTPSGELRVFSTPTGTNGAPREVTVQERNGGPAAKAPLAGEAE